jgi:Ca2+-transporting ATPase
MAIAAGAEHDKGEKLARTMAFTTFGLANLFFSFTARDELRSVFTLETFRDRTFLTTSLMSVAAIIFGTELQFFQRVLDSVELTGNQWLICIAGGLLIVAVSEVWKFFLRRSDAAARAEAPQEALA